MSTTLIPSTAHGTPTGNYDGSSTSFESDSAWGDGYYGYTDGLHTVSVSTAGFVGTITIQGTLVETPTSSDWFTVKDTAGADLVYGDGSTTTTVNEAKNFIVNAVHVRAAVASFSAGAIAKINFNH
jgi:hypothetical protein